MVAPKLAQLEHSSRQDNPLKIEDRPAARSSSGGPVGLDLFQHQDDVFIYLFSFFIGNLYHNMYHNM